MLVTDTFKKRFTTIKRSIFHSHYPILVRASFECAIKSMKPISKVTLLESVRLENMISIANDNTTNDTKQSVVIYLNGLNGMKCNDGFFEATCKSHEQHTFNLLTIIKLLDELEEYHGSEFKLAEKLANADDNDIESLTGLIKLT
ncbi:TPA: hypothetical protein ACGUU0_004076 [Vibrio vulnificus]|uniref:hypothetical protein n=1 Tax=Vibrio parahaemolyticus TaxID=670 RepID=UPI0004DF7AB6|nr:hypothetical protein [Vibrio parahaemolyticus]